MVLKYLNEDELFKVAMNIESQGIEFYQSAFEKAAIDKTKDIFKFLNREEKHHYEIFKKMDLEIKRIKFRPGEIDEEISLYLRSLVDSGVFENILPKEQWQNINDKQALNIGIQVEKTSILFYSGIKEITEVPTSLPALDKIIQEEKNHLIALTTLWKEIDK
ncbi:MAG: ferritin family protein [Candidatus Omnitrophica bacterium]|nr:ferritin family protein [Candidatus Omnitrophota bacterium]MCM8829359.1 ferritin family protein [Candidatus Omnitrophota bacterium]